MTRMSNSAARRRRASEVLSDPSPSIRSLARPRRPDCAAAAAIGCRPGVWNANALPLAVSRASLAVSRGPTVRPRQPPAAGPGSGMPARCHWQCHAPAGLGQCGPGSVPARGPGRLRPVCCASAAPLLRLCCASAAPSLRLCCAFIARLPADPPTGPAARRRSRRTCRAPAAAAAADQDSIFRCRLGARRSTSP